MGRQKRKSKTLDDVNKRISGMTTIDKDLDFGGDLTLAKFKEASAKFSADLDNYNKPVA